MKNLSARKLEASATTTTTNTLKFTIITWILAAGSFTGVVVNIQKMELCFWIWGVTNLSWAIIDYKRKIYAQAVLQLGFFGLAIWGILAW